MTYATNPVLALTTEPIPIGAVAAAGPAIDAIYLTTTEMYTATAAGAGTFTLSLWDGSAITAVTTTQDWYSYGAPTFQGWSDVLRVRPSTPANFLAGIPAGVVLEEYPFIRAKLSIAGTPTSGKL